MADDGTTPAKTSAHIIKIPVKFFEKFIFNLPLAILTRQFDPSSAETFSEVNLLNIIWELLAMLLICKTEGHRASKVLTTGTI